MKKVVCLFIACLLLLASLGASLAEVVEVRSEETTFVHHNAAIFGGEKDASMYLKITYPADFDAEKTYPAVIGSHGFNANSLYFDLLWTETLAKNGYLVYTFDFCGGAMPDSFLAPRSEGDITEMSVLTEVDDLNATIDYVKEQPNVDVDRIFLMGISQGGLITALAAGERAANGIDDLRGIILFYPGFGIQDGVKDVYTTAEELPTEATLWNGATLGPRYFKDIYDLDAYSVSAAYNGNVLIVHGINDPGSYMYSVDLLAKSYPSQNAQFLLVAGEKAVHSFDAPFAGYPEGADMAVTAVLGALSNWQNWEK